MSNKKTNQTIGLLIILFFLIILILPHFIISLKSLIKENLYFGIIITITLSLGTILSLWTYIMTNQTNPGYIKKSKNTLDIENANSIEKIKTESKNLKSKLNENKKKLENLLTKKNTNFKEEKERLIKENKEIYIKSTLLESYCFKCNILRVQRVHHCVICEKCIEIWDHHCPLMGNCIGKFNKRFFVQFLFYSSVSLLFNNLAILVFRIKSFNGNNALFKGFGLLVIFSNIFGIIVGFSTFCFFCFHLFLVFKNVTTLEIYYVDRKNNPFDKGACGNLRDVCGKKFNIFHIFFPIRNKF